VMVLQCARKDLRGRRRAAVDQHHQRNAGEQLAGRGRHAELRGGRATVGGHDDAIIEQLVGDFHGRLEHAARVVAQVDDDAARPAATLATHARQPRSEIQRGGVAEGGDARVDEAAVELEHGDAVYVDLRALHRELQRQRGTIAHHGQLHRRAARPAHPRHGRVQVGAHRHAVDRRDHVAALDPSHCRRRIAKWSHHAQCVVRGRHFDPDAGVRARSADAQVGVFLGIQIG